MFTIEIAGLLVEIDNRYEEIRERCKDYIVEAEREPDMRAWVTDQMMEPLLQWWKKNDPEHIPMGRIEFYALHGSIYPRLPFFDAAWMHASAVEVDGEGYAFTAPSGYGKTTQSLLWLKYFGDRARIINRDNPIIRFMKGGCYLCGSPFGGSEGYQYNTQIPLRGICFLTHSEENRIVRMDPAMAFAQMIQINQEHKMIYASNQEALMSVWERIAGEIPIYQLYCNQSLEAVEVAYRGMHEMAGSLRNAGTASVD
ncbi:MAG: hypothetical protein LUH07_04370 [Lachnospiraceae bacterium]|nr:hypothetical protein [Lachnospiraceae bacterium]